MTKASDNLFPKLILVEGSAPSSPSAGDQALYIDSSDHKLKRKNSGGAVTVIEGASLLYDYEVSGSDKASIDTFVDDGGFGASVNLSGAYKVLKAYFYVRTDQSGTPFVTYDVTFNNDTGANYDRMLLEGQDTTVGAGASVGQTKLQGYTPGSSNGANFFGNGEFTIHNYAGTVGYKVGSLHTGIVDSTGSNCDASIWAINYRSASAITRMKVAAPSSQKFKVGSRLTIYGI